MLLLGIDIGTSSVKVAVVDATTQNCIAAAQFPETEERLIKSIATGYAEQSPLQWWDDTKEAIQKLHAGKKYDPKDIKAIGISYQMHGLVLADKEQQVLRDAIIWCDSRAVDIGNKAFDSIGETHCLSHLLNSPGNFTASKLAWVKEHEPLTYHKIDKILLPGDFIAMKLTGETSTSAAALSEAVMWDFKTNTLSEKLFNYFGFDKALIPPIKNVFAEHGRLPSLIAAELSLTKGIPVTYKAGDQPNNALSLNVLNPGEVAATAGTSGVIYAVTDQLLYDNQSRVNSFAHVNHTGKENRIGVLLCINGTGILNRWIKEIAGNELSYGQVNDIAGTIQPGSNGLQLFPFGNGAERMLNNRTVNAHIQNIDLNVHTRTHIFRAAQEGIAFAFRYGLDILKDNGLLPTVIRAGKANMFLSDVFKNAFVNATNIPVELYDCDGSVGAAIGAGIGAKIFADPKEAFSNFKPIEKVEPKQNELHNELYMKWKKQLDKHLIQ